MTLTPEQQAVVDAPEDNVLILAGPGTGKSHTMLGKIMDLVEKGATPSEIYILCFTNANAKDLKNKIQTDLKLGEGVALPQVYTLHSFALRQLMKNGVVQEVS